MKPFVLVVDDSVTVRMELRELLSRAHFAVAACSSVASARQMLRGRPCDLAIVDMVLPDGSGLDLLGEIKGDQELSHIPVIIVSDDKNVRAAGRALEKADGCFEKPVDRNQLMKLAESLSMSGIRGKRFLIVDDSPTFMHALGTQLQQYGGSVETATSGEEALVLASRETFDCAIIDMVMPGIGGLETCRRMRALAAQDHLFVVMLTAGENISGRSQGLAIGADQFLLKSHRIDMLCTQIQEVLRKRAPGQRGSKPDSLPPSARSVPMCEQVMALLGMSKTISKLVLTRVCRVVGIEPDALTQADLPRILPALRENLSIFLTPEQIAVRLDALRQFLRPDSQRLVG